MSQNRPDEKGARPRWIGRDVPWPLVVAAAVGLGFLVLPLIGLLARTPWTSLLHQLAQPGSIDALRLSLLSSTGALILSLLCGVPLAWLLSRTEFRGREIVRVLVLIPLVLPPVVGGVALLLAFGPRGLLGPALAHYGLVVPFTTVATVLSATFVSLPFMVVAVEGALRSLGTDHEDVAATLGASPLRIFWTVTMPAVRPAVIAGGALTWARALGEFGATITFAGNIKGVTQTLPLAVYLALPVNTDAAFALSTLMLGICGLVLFGLRGRWVPPLFRGGGTAP